MHSLKNSASSDFDKQTVEIRAAGALPTREIRLAFRNIRHGDVIATAGGAPLSVLSDDDGYLTVILPQVKRNVTYRVEVAFAADTRAFRNERFLYSLQRFAGEYALKETLYRKLAALSDSECREAILAETALTKNQKKRLLEGLT